MKQNYQANIISVKKWSPKTYLFLLTGIFLSLVFKAQQTYTFTNCGATGTVGPTQTMVNASYTNTNLQGMVGTLTTGIQTWTVPQSGSYRIDCRGASGGTAYSSAGGNGAKMVGDFTLTVGEVIRILVGQRGMDGSSSTPGGGGGGSFVVRTPYTTTASCIIAAGGGSGSGNYSFTDAVTSNTAVSATSGGAGGTNGNGGAGGSRAAGGGGFLTDGGDCTVNTVYSAKGLAFVNGGQGGPYSGHTCGFSAEGGFGGGAMCGGNCIANGGAGGGFSGGGGSFNNTPAGGGSINQGTNQTNTVLTINGDGRVFITELCSITLSATGLGANNAICSGASVTLTTNAVSNYSWSNGSTASSIVLSPSSSGIFSVVGTSSAACTAASSISITVNGSLPSLSIANTASSSAGICLGKSATLTASGALSYTWTGSNTPTVTNGVNFTPTATTAYTVTGTNGCGQSSATTSITIAPLVVTASASSSLVCQGSTVMLTATSSVNGYTWYPNGATSNPLTTGPQANTIYTVIASDGTCVGSATVAVNTNPIPTISVAASNSLVCEGTPVTLTASGASTFTWTNPASNSAVISVTPSGATNYQVYGSNASGCFSSGSQLILTNAAPVLTVTATKMIVCVGGSVNITASSAAGVTYAWAGGPTTSVNLVNPTSPTTYSVVGTGTNGCPSPEYMITINTLSTNLSVSAATTAICEGKSTTLTATGANTYTWTGIPSFQGNAMVSPTTTTIYTVVANTTITGLSCPSTTNISIAVNSNPTITVNATKTVVCRSDANIVLTATGAVTYSWSANTNSASTTAGNVSVHPTILNNNIYSVSGMDANGCVNSGSITIKVNACNGIADLNGSANSIMVYPNPSNGDFNVSTTSEINLNVVNGLGQVVKTLELTQENKFKGEVTNLANGVYFIVGQNAYGKINQKVVVNK